MADEYYLQDARSYVGNAVLWWAHDCNGYTTDLAEAHVFDRAGIERIRRECGRETDVPWPRHVVEASVSSMVDIQRLRRISDSLTGETIGEPEK